MLGGEQKKIARPQWGLFPYFTKDPNRIMVGLRPTLGHEKYKLIL